MKNHTKSRLSSRASEHEEAKEVDPGSGQCPLTGSRRSHRHVLISAALRTGRTNAVERAIATWRGRLDAHDWIDAALACRTTPEHLRPVLKEIAELAGPAMYERARRKSESEIARRCRDEYLARDEVIRVGPELAFPDDYHSGPNDNDTPEGRGPNSTAVRGVLERKTCGWPTKPTSREFHEAVRKQTADKTPRERTLSDAFFTEATDAEILRAWAEGAFTWRQAARTMRNNPGTSSRRARWLNQRADYGTWAGFRLWNQ